MPTSVYWLFASFVTACGASLFFAGVSGERECSRSAVSAQAPAALLAIGALLLFLSIVWFVAEQTEDRKAVRAAKVVFIAATSVSTIGFFATVLNAYRILGTFSQWRVTASTVLLVFPVLLAAAGHMAWPRIRGTIDEILWIAIVMGVAIASIGLVEFALAAPALPLARSKLGAGWADLVLSASTGIAIAAAVYALPPTNVRPSSASG